ncbi:50S ribosomal protein L27 [Candidatus Dojkabacteria bacterium]|uniref:Large ribosomal subunit protein bL27 n=1 Tax=Candidatus Dojkabacteria bacterium TaxID=2099670 RepID=A0A955RK51_9BACT|nr:50S ribosomal protein L27 [Candidatus Dojkabacteria bacterium]
MAKHKSQGSAKRTVNVAGKRRGVKRYGGQTVNAGEIIVRQLGTKFHPGKNAGIGKDHTIFAKVTGIVRYREMTGYKRGQKCIDILLPEDLEKPVKKKKSTVKQAKKTTTKSTAKKTTETKKTTKKPAAKKKTTSNKK